MLDNTEIADDLERVATLLELESANPFRVRAYRDAARLVSNLAEPVSELVSRGEDLTHFRGIGKDLAGKIAELAKTGHLPILDELKKKEPKGLLELTKVPGLGARKIQVLREELGVTGLKSLAKAARAGRIAELHGFGQKSQARILQEIEILAKRGAEARRRIDTVEPVAEALALGLGSLAGVEDAVVCGSYRRRRETVGDLDVVVTCKRPEPVIDAFASRDDVERVLSKGPTRSTVKLRSGLQVDLRVVPGKSLGAALLYFTGSKAHNIALRQRALARKLKINEYGVFRGERRIAGATEEEIYRLLGLDWIPPELREDRGEIEAAETGALPDLVEVSDLRGDLHSHTTATDGRSSLEEMAAAAQALGYSYLAITEHTQAVRVAGGLDAEAMRRHAGRIDELNARLKGFRLLKGAEVDILEDGRLDLPDDVLERLDVRVCSIHSRFRESREVMTERILRAMDNPNFNILGHPTGRLIGEREPYAVDLERIFEAARERGCIMEIDSQPSRLDLNDVFAKLARDMGVGLSISSDAHSADGLALIRYGVGQARRAWVTADDVVNTRSWPELAKLLQR